LNCKVSILLLGTFRVEAHTFFMALRHVYISGLDTPKLQQRSLVKTNKREPDPDLSMQSQAKDIMYIKKTVTRVVARHEGVKNVGRKKEDAYAWSPGQENIEGEWTTNRINRRRDVRGSRHKTQQKETEKETD